MIVNVIPLRRVEMEERGVEEQTITAMTMTIAINSNNSMHISQRKPTIFGQVRTSA